jgi:hypothetical protein
MNESFIEHELFTVHCGKCKEMFNKSFFFFCLSCFMQTNVIDYTFEVVISVHFPPHFLHTQLSSDLSWKCLLLQRITKVTYYRRYEFWSKMRL